MKKTNILIIEDHQVARKVGALILSQLDCEVDGASNAAQALACVSLKCYDIIFIDIGLPDEDGLLLVEQIRKSGTLNHQAQFIILTAHANGDYKKKAAAIGVSDFIVKPLTMEKCKEILAARSGSL